jgi:glycosyltransferase involved in cell wall biosynthesis
MTHMPISADDGFVLVTPVRNEERTIEITIQSVVAQTVPPREWVVVSDGSTDQTDAIVDRYVRQFNWLRLVQLKNRPGRNFASVVFATETGIQALRTRAYAYLGLLDADVRFPENYFAQMLTRFAKDVRLGLAGGLVVDVVDGKRFRDRQSLQNVAGAVQFFRRECFESLGGLVPVAEGGWDAITCVRARMNGYRTETFADLIVEHLKPRNVAEGGPLRRHWQFGTRDYALASHPVFELAKCCARWGDFPPVLGALARLSGYGWAAVRNRKRQLPPDVCIHIRREQLARLNPFKTVWPV